MPGVNACRAGDTAAALPASLQPARWTAAPLATTPSSIKVLLRRAVALFVSCQPVAAAMRLSRSLRLPIRTTPFLLLAPALPAPQQPLCKTSVLALPSPPPLVNMQSEMNWRRGRGGRGRGHVVQTTTAAAARPSPQAIFPPRAPLPESVPLSCNTAAAAGQRVSCPLGLLPSLEEAATNNAPASRLAIPGLKEHC